MLVLWRLLQAIMVAILIGIATFAMMRALPGEAAWRIAAGRYGYDNLDVSAAERVRDELQLDGAIFPALVRWLGDLAQLEFGTSMVSGRPVWDEVAHQLGASVQLAAFALVLSLLIGLPLGILAGLRKDGWIDRFLLLISTGLKAVPQFLLALVLIVLVSVQLRWLPAAGYGEIKHFVLPGLTLALGLSAVSARIVRDAMAQVVGALFYNFAQWKGLSNMQVLLRHGLPNIAVPLLTYLGLQFVTLVEGVVIVESIFAWPGIGHALVHAIFSRDVPMVQGTTLILGLGFITVNTLIDLAVSWIDPRRTR